MTYAEKLRDPKWQKKRLEVLSRDSFTCQRCLDETKTLHVHHKDYRPGWEPWDYPIAWLITLCETCHAAAHHAAQNEAIEQLVEVLKMGAFFPEDIHRLISGIAKFDGYGPQVLTQVVEAVLSDIDMTDAVIRHKLAHYVEGPTV